MVDNLWHMAAPRRNWYEHRFVDGDLSDFVRLPVVQCPQCGQGWSSSRYLPFECPFELCGQIRIHTQAMKSKYQNSLICFDEFRHYATRWEAVLRKHGYTLELLPGDAFAPRLWRVPAIPRYHIFWPQLHDPIIGEVIKQRCEDAEVSGISFRPIVLDKVGEVELDGEMSNPEMMPQSGDMGDYFNEFPYCQEPPEYGCFYEMEVKNHTGPRIPEDGVEVISKCVTCGRREVKESVEFKRQRNYYRKKKLLPSHHTFELDMFWSHIFYEGFVATDKVREIMSPECMNNCQVERITVTKSLSGN